MFRLNFSHGSIETHRKNLDIIRGLEKKYNHATCILADLQGPKLRVGEFEKTEENLKKGQKFILDLNIYKSKEYKNFMNMSFNVDNSLTYLILNNLQKKLS